MVTMKLHLIWEYYFYFCGLYTLPKSYFGDEKYFIVLM